MTLTEELEQLRYAADCPVSGTPEDAMALWAKLEEAYRSGRLVEKSPEVASWNTMDTAPIEPFNQELWFKSQKPLLLTNGYGISIGAYSYTERGKGRWMVYGRTYVPTHWMPLPQTPPQRERI